MGGRMDQLMVQVDEEVPGHVGWKGTVWLKCGEDGKVLVALERAPLQKNAPFARRARPFGGGRALVAYLIGRGLKPLGGLVISSFSFMQLRVDEISDPLAVIQ
jgi:hypothetical protein